MTLLSPIPNQHIMNNQNPERLYNLLPAIYRIRDETQNGSLRALLGIIEQELEIIETDIENLYENWFIETCDEWVIPYIGDLLAVNLYTEQSRTYGQERRAYIANTLAYRRRKGTAPILEQLITDITGWRSRVVEYFKLVGTTQNLNNLQTEKVFANLRQTSQIERLGTPFEESVSHTVEIRNISNQNGKYNIANIGIFLWRLKSYPMNKVTAHPIKIANSPHQGRFYTFHPLGIDIPLFNQPQTENEINILATETNLPTPLRRLILAAEIEARRQLITEGKNPLGNGYFGDNPVLQIFLNHQSISPECIMIDDLSEWHISSIRKNDEIKDFPIQVKVDPELGRLIVLGESTPQAVEVSYSYAFSGEIGGGSYDRSQFLNIPESVSFIQWNVKQKIKQLNIQQPAENKVFSSEPIEFVSPVTITKKNKPTKPTFPNLVTAIQEWNKNVKIWEYCQEKIYLELQHLSINNQSQIILSNKNILSQFKPGVVNGLTVTAQKKASKITIASGTAVDSQGNRIYLGINHQVSLKDYANQTVFLVIFPKVATKEPKWEIKLISASEVSQTTGVLLASLVINPIGQIENANTKIAPQFQPGIIYGLEVQLTNSLEKKVLITPGKAVNSKAKLIHLEESKELNLNIHPNQRGIIYITPKRKINTVPDVETTIITIKDNHTYQGNFTVKIPADKKLQIIAANEYQPHLQSNLLIQGTARKNTNPGELKLDGLLISGKITVLPGNLKKLHIANCTVLSKTEALTVKKIERQIDTELTADNDLSLLAIIIYFLTLIQKILNLGIKVDSATSPNNLTKLFQLAFQKITRFFSFLQEIPQVCQTLELPDENSQIKTDFPNFWELENTEETDNTKLQVSIDSSICGNILLADTVANLEIVDSIIEKKWYKNPEIYQGNHSVITALGSHVKINRTTIFGRTNINTLEASNSIFNEIVTVLRTQIGYIRFCYLPYGSRTPSRYCCQPDLALAKVSNLPENVTAIGIHHTTNKVFAGTAGKGIFYLDNNIWKPTNSNLTNQNVTTLLTNIPTAIADRYLILAGTTDGGIFSSIDNGETWNLSNTVIINDNAYSLAATDITALITYNKSLSGVIASKGTQVTGEGTKFNQELTKDSLIIAAGEIRTVTAIISDIELEINQAFTNDLPLETTYTSQYILMGTDSGVFRSQNNSKTWQPVNSGLRNLQIQTLAVNHDNGEIFAGTANGVYRLNNPGNYWNYVHRNLAQNNVTAIAINQFKGQVFIGTRNGIFRSQNDCQKWKLINHDLTDTDITALATYTKPGTGTISSNGTKITGINTVFLTELSKGSVIHVGNETRTVITVEQNNLLVIDAAFNDNLPPETTFSINYLLAGTMGGYIFISKNNGNNWQRITTSLTLTAITTLAVNTDNQYIYAGTSAGNILYSKNDGNNWSAINQGFDNFDQKSIIITSYKPSFTSEKYGEPSYAQLSKFCIPAIKTGAEDASEMGVFNYLQQAQRETNLRASLNEYLRFGLEAGIFYIN